MKRKLSDITKRDAWLDLHVSHRLRAGLAESLQLQAYISAKNTATLPPQLRERCLGNAAWEGRMAAARWLIEFIGIQWDNKNGKPKRPPRKGTHDVWIEDMDGGIAFDLTKSEALELAKVWKGCSQASSHPTDDSNHFDVSPPQLARAIEIIIWSPQSMPQLDQKSHSTFDRCLDS